MVETPVFSRLRSHLGFMAVAYRIIGVLQCITVLGAVTGIPTYLTGVHLSRSLRAFRLEPGVPSHQIEAGLESIASAMLMQKVALLVQMGLVAFYIYFVGSTIGIFEDSFRKGLEEGLFGT